MTWIVGATGPVGSGFRMGIGKDDAAILSCEIYLCFPQRTRRFIWRDPTSLRQDFMGTEPRFVVHLWALADPIAKVDMGKRQLARLIDLPQHAVRAIACGGIGFIER